MADGHPDLSGVWWTGGDIGSPGYASSTGGTPPPTVYTDLYQPWAKEKMASLKDKDDPTLKCQPTAFGTLSVRLFDVGAEDVGDRAVLGEVDETVDGFDVFGKVADVETAGVDGIAGEEEAGLAVV
jgi:hypothetical protein